MSGIPVVVSEHGFGLPVKQVDDNAPVMTVSEHGFGIPIVLSDWGVPFIVEGLTPVIPDLNALTLSDSTITEDEAVTINILGATTGSTITVQSGALPNGLVLNSGARTISGTPTVVDEFTFTLREALTGSSNSPRDTALGIDVEAVPDASLYGRDPNFNGGTAHTYTVSDDGSGDFPTIQAALDQLVTDGTGGSIGIKKETLAPYAPASITGYSGPLITISSYGTDQPVIGPKRLPTLVPCDVSDEPLLGSIWTSAHKVTINTSEIDHTSYHALIPTENGELLTLATRRADETDLFAQDDTNTFFEGISPDLIFTVDGSGYITSIQHTSVLSAYSDTQLAACVAGVFGYPNLFAPTPVVSATGGVLALDPAAAITPQPGSNKYSLMNIAPEMAVGGWCFLEDAGTITIFVRLTDPANADKINIAAHIHALTIQNSANVIVEGPTFAQTSGTGVTDGSPLFMDNCTDVLARQVTVRDYSHDRRGYGSLFVDGGTRVGYYESDLENGQNSFGFHPRSASFVTVQGIKTTRVSQTIPRIFTCTDSVFADIRLSQCGFAAHANLFNPYLFCNRVVFKNFNPLTDAQGRPVMGYAAISASSNIVVYNSIIPAGPDGRALIDQFVETQDPPETTSLLVIANCLIPAIPGRSDMADEAVEWGNPWHLTDFRLLNCAYHGIKPDGSGVIAGSTLTLDGNVRTLGTPETGEVAARPIDIYMNDGAGDFRTIPGSVLTAPGELPDDMTAIVEMMEGWRPDYDFRTDALGNAWNPADPGVGPYGTAWPVATDTTKPVLSGLSAESSGLNVTATVTTDKFGGNLAWSLDDGINPPTAGSQEVLQAGVQNVPIIAPEEGEYTLTLTHTDRFGNVSDPLSVPVTVAGYTPVWTAFDGSTRLRRAAALTGAQVLTKQMLIAYTFRMTAAELAAGQMNSGMLTTLPSTAGGGNLDIGPTPGFRLRDPASSSNIINMLARTSGDAALAADTDYLVLFRYSSDAGGRLGETALIDVVTGAVILKQSAPAPDADLSFAPVTQTDLFRADQGSGDGGFSVERMMIWDDASPDITDSAVQQVFANAGELQDPQAAHTAFGAPLIDVNPATGQNRGNGGDFNIV